MGRACLASIIPNIGTEFYWRDLESGIESGSNILNYLD